MALARMITKAVHAALVPALQVEYKADATGENFILDATGFEDPAELRRAKDREKARADEAETKLADATTKLSALGPDAQRKLADITVIEKSHQDKYNKDTTELKNKLADKDRYIESQLIDSVALKMATDLAGDNAGILTPHIKTRLKIEHNEGGSPLTRVLDKDGKPSALSVSDLQKEFSENPQYKVLVIATKGSGGGAAGSNTGAGGGAAGAGGDKKKFKDLSTAERKEWFDRDKAGFMEASKAAEQERIEQSTAAQRVQYA